MIQINFARLSNLNVQDSMIKRLEIQNETKKILIWQYSQIENLLLLKKIDSFRIEDSKANLIRGTSGLFILEFENYYSNITSAYNIFEKNINGCTEEVYNVIRIHIQSIKIMKNTQSIYIS